MTNTYKLSVDDIKRVSTDYSNEFALAKIAVLSTKPNSHKIPITDKILRESGDTIRGKWVIAEYDKWKHDVTTHTPDTKIIGIIPKDTNIEYVVDEKLYEEPLEIVLQTTHKDVFLDYFKGKKEFISSLRSGMSLKVEDVYLCAEKNGRDIRVAKFSRNFVEKLKDLENKGYKLTDATIRFIVLWKKEDDEDEVPIVLSNLTFSK